MDLVKGTQGAWNTRAHFRTTDRDRVAIMENGDRLAVLWSYQDHAPQFIEYTDPSAAEEAFAQATLRAVKARRISPMQGESLPEHDGGADVIVRYVAELRRGLHDRGVSLDQTMDGILCVLEDQARDLLLVENDR